MRPIPPRDESGQTTVMIVGFAVVLMTAVGMVVNVSAAYLQRQSLDNLADGAALTNPSLAQVSDKLEKLRGSAA